jgi:hypothetical protein
MHIRNINVWSKAPHGEPPYQPELWNKKNEIKETHNCYTYMLNDLYKVPRIYGKPQPGYYVKSNGIGHTLSCREVMKGVELDNPHIKLLSIKNGRNYMCPPHHYKGFMIVSPGNDYHFARQDNRLIKVYRSIHKDIYNNKIKLKPDANFLVNLFLHYCKREIPEIVDLAYSIHGMNIKTEKDYLKSIYNCSRTWSHKPGGTNVTDKDADGKLILDPQKANWNYHASIGGINYNKHCCYYSIPTNYAADTFSSGVPNEISNNRKNNPQNIRKDLSVNLRVDTKYEKLIKTICSK